LDTVIIFSAIVLFKRQSNRFLLCERWVGRRACWDGWMDDLGEHYKLPSWSGRLLFVFMAMKRFPGDKNTSNRQSFINSIAL